MKAALYLAICMIPLGCFANEVKCVTDYHVLAHYEDNSGKAIERQQIPFSFSYEKGTPAAKEIVLQGKNMRAYVGEVYDAIQNDGTGKFIEGVQIAILNGEEWAVVQAPIQSKMLQASTYSRMKPAVLPSEISRDYFWTITCRW